METPFSSCGKSRSFLHIAALIQFSQTSCAAPIGWEFSSSIFWAECDLGVPAKIQVVYVLPLGLLLEQIFLFP